MKSLSIHRFVHAATVALVALSIASMTLTAAPVQAAPAASAVLFGSVDTAKVLTGYTKKAALDQQVQELGQRLEAQFKQQGGANMLNKDQQAQLGALLGKTTLTDADRAQITALIAQSNKDAQELATLQQKKDLSSDEKSRLEDLTKQAQASQQVLQDVGTAYQDQLQAERERLSAQLSELVKAAISAVAVQKGLAVVFDSQVAIYTANDITDDVLKRLNK